ncbi:MAG: 23S rRNA (pseudouridine(1915)-N(3))-methyltransferase RlmH [Legionellales bacterium]|nr:23S rRNA (pseudouridine(1915)-N(3))-methyltransferase RlmH [Legionellales bacterium]
MRIGIISVGQKMSEWANQEFIKYKERLNSSIKLELIEVPLLPVKKRNISVIQQESKHLLQHADKFSLSIALDPKGKELNSDLFAKKIKGWREDNLSTCFLIGGPEGLSKEVLQKSDSSWSLSKLTFPHMLIRVMIAEQIYRGYCKNINHPYYK